MIDLSADRYRIIDEIGHGGMSTVYRGVDTVLDREVAIKVLHEHLAKRPENVRRFQREAKAIARLRHDNILEVYDYSGLEDERAYIVMEFVPGMNLFEHGVEFGPVPAEVAALIAVEICHALDHAHQHGVIHRDLKPENIMISTNGVIKLMDFGIARVLDAESMTRTGSLMGSPSHMAPEMIDGGKDVDKRVDIFALGTVLFWLVTRRLPFEGTNAPQVLQRVLSGVFEDPEIIDPKVGYRFGEIVRRALAYQPDDRYPTTQAVLTDLNDVLSAVGWSDQKSALASYLDGPSAFIERLEKDLPVILLESADKLLRESKVADGVATLNRLLAYRPNDPEVAKKLRNLHRRHLASRLAVVICLAVVVVTVLGALLARELSDDTEPPATTRIVEVTDADPDESRPVLVETPAPPEEPPAAVRDAARELANTVAIETIQSAETTTSTPPRIRQRKPRNTVAPAAQARVETDAGRGKTQDSGAAESPPQYAQRFRLLPPAAKLLVNGRRYTAIQALKGIELPEGTHDLVARSKGCKVWRTRMIVHGPQKKVKPIVLEWLDGNIRIMTNTKALVWADGNPDPRPIGARGENATLHFPFGLANQLQSSRKILLRIAPRHDLKRARTQEVELRPGQDATVNVQFERP
jgi:eukaryotic-like serine/threonine-protein kinase